MKKPIQQFETVNSMYGAPMGRTTSEAPQGPTRIIKVKLDAGGYDDGGAYFGIGKPLYCLTDGNGYVKYHRTETMKGAKLHFNKFSQKL